MAKVLRCNDVMPGCPFEARGTEEEILQSAAQHAAKDHDIKEMTPEIASKVRGAIKEE